MANRDPWTTALELVDEHGVGATHVATTREAALYYEDRAEEREFWRVVAENTVKLLRDRGDIE